MDNRLIFLYFVEIDQRWLLESLAGLWSVPFCTEGAASHKLRAARKIISKLESDSLKLF